MRVHFYCHLQSGIRITGMDGDAYVVETSFAIVRTMQEGDMSIFCAGKFVDEIVFDGDTPLFRKTAVTDSNRILLHDCHTHLICAGDLKRIAIATMTQRASVPRLRSRHR